MFAQLYEKLYSSQLQSSQQSQEHIRAVSNVSEFTMEELRSALNFFKRGKAKDPFGIAAEALHFASNRFLGLLLELFNDVISFRKAPPDQWKATRLVVIFKKGDASLPKITDPSP